MWLLLLHLGVCIVEQNALKRVHFHHLLVLLHRIHSAAVALSKLNYNIHFIFMFNQKVIQLQRWLNKVSRCMAIKRRLMFWFSCWKMCINKQTNKWQPHANIKKESEKNGEEPHDKMFKKIEENWNRKNANKITCNTVLLRKFSNLQ